MSTVFSKVYETVKKIPVGNVTTYGEISRSIRINNPRTVGWALHANKDKRVPCHRVVNKQGLLGKGFAFGGWRVQKDLLLSEGVTFVGEKQVDLEKHLWDCTIESSR